MTIIPAAKHLNVKIVVEFHSSCIEYAKLPVQYVDYFISHDENVYKNSPNNPARKSIIEMGVPEIRYKKPPNKRRLVSLGLARNMNNYVNDLVYALRNDFSNIHFDPSYGTENWKSSDDLMEYLQDSDIITLIYPPVGAGVSSNSVGLAITAGRPVLVSNTNWFEHVKDHPQVFTVDHTNVTEGAKVIRKLLVESPDFEQSTKKFQEQRGWSVIADKHLEIYNSILK